ncbi:hypothetical protein CCR75_001742 [Bremia lactucae]|uniref:Uncharacterized protein n=1 Tax=Bremia lactucae TaxID=4779 RepID=A0A976IBT2_BRELC|nr:hypothetical protein CCR75_001742 [Bremia lactucae]
MQTRNFLVIALAAASQTAYGKAHIETISGPIEQHDNSQFAKQWTLQSDDYKNTLDSIRLSFDGKALIHRVNYLPEGVLGFVNVTGHSFAAVDAVSISHEDAYYDVADRFDDFDSEDVSDSDFDFDSDDNFVGRYLDISVPSDRSSGRVRIVITLAPYRSVRRIKTERKANVVIENNVLINSGAKATLAIKSVDYSSVLVESPRAYVTLQVLSLKASNSASITYKAGYLVNVGLLKVSSIQHAAIAFVCDSIKVQRMQLKALVGGRMCFSAHQIKARKHDVDGKKMISMSNANKKYGTKGDDSCRANDYRFL